MFPKGITEFCDLMWMGQKVNTQQQNINSSIKVLVIAGNWTRELSHPIYYLRTTESTDSIDCCQAF